MIKNQVFCFLKKNACHTTPIYGNCVASIFFMATQKYFQIILKLHQIFFSTTNRIMYANERYFAKKLHAKSNFLCAQRSSGYNNVGFFSFSLDKKAENSYFLYVSVCVDHV